MSGLGRGRASALPHWMTREGDGRGLGDDRRGTTTTGGADASASGRGDARGAGWTYVLSQLSNAREHVREAGGVDERDGARRGVDALATVLGGGGRERDGEDVLGARCHGRDDVGDAEGDFGGVGGGAKGGGTSIGGAGDGDGGEGGRGRAGGDGRGRAGSIEEAKSAFKKMLAEHGVRASTKWTR